ncbi:MAG: hypothetical protein BGO01_12000 [Armatimonadetes bacterium 55-13]|nr:serpin family protein [Armatimonadota bacterium]OJU63512.1 MAG: hypothetical protein BGO01_12000 [Armatimonadetes bacterium 55-13]
MTQRVLSVAIVGALGLIGCGDSPEEPNLPLPTPTQQEAGAKMQSKVNDFVFRLINASTTPTTEGNVCIAPLSVSLCLSALLNGASGSSIADLETTLGYKGLSLQEVNDGSYAIVQGLLGSKGSPITVANSIWIRGDFKPKPAYVSSLSNYYRALLTPVKNFQKPTVDKINAWTSEKTKERIPKLFDSLDPATVVVLANALTFDGKWSHPFKKQRTAQAAFHLANGDTIQVPRMFGNFEVPYYEAETWKAIRLPYQGEEFSMICVLPKESPIQWLRKQTSKSMSDLIQNLKSGGIDTPISIPRFNASYTLDLEAPLSNLGMGKLFKSIELNNLADFGPLKDQLSIGEAVHKTYIKVDEEGTEAAATGIGVKAAAFRGNFLADRPFAYFIVHHKTNLVLFAGVCADPRS